MNHFRTAAAGFLANGGIGLQYDHLVAGTGHGARYCQTNDACTYDDRVCFLYWHGGMLSAEPIKVNSGLILAFSGPISFAGEFRPA